MAIHSFVCDGCNVVVEDTNTKGVHKCPECGGDMRWDLNMSIHGNYKHPIHSDALAINPNQRAEHERLFPNIEIDKQNRPVFDNYVNHRNYLEKTGHVKLPQKIKPKSIRIA